MEFFPPRNAIKKFKDDYNAVTSPAHNGPSLGRHLGIDSESHIAIYRVGFSSLLMLHFYFMYGYVLWNVGAAGEYLCSINTSLSKECNRIGACLASRIHLLDTLWVVGLQNTSKTRREGWRMTRVVPRVWLTTELKTYLPNTNGNASWILLAAFSIFICTIHHWPVSQHLLNIL